jgi:hypothetical protein
LSFVRGWKWVMVLGLAAITLGGAGAAPAENYVLGDLRLSHLIPDRMAAIEHSDEGTVERFLVDTLRTVERRTYNRTESPFMIPFRKTEHVQDTGDLSPWKVGTPIPGLLAGLLARRNSSSAASLQSVLASAGAAPRILLDTDDLLSTTGSLVGNPSKLFAGFEILVDTHKYSLKLVGVTFSGTRNQLFISRVGLGSTDYPTPRGSFYISVIYDDKPLWIPPPSDWAWGQQPSHSVYGGHMMPFFKKTPLAKADRTDELVEDLDNIASPMKLVDGGMYRIHGTDSPWSVGSGQSHGCVRMLNKSVKGLADTLKLYVGVTGRSRSANGSYVSLARPVKLTLF